MNGLDEYRATLIARGRTPHHINTTCRHVRELLALLPMPPTEQAIVKAVGTVLAKGRSLRTCNAYLRSIKSYVRWCVRAEVLIRDTAKDIVPYKQEKDRRHRRTAFSEDQLATLLITASKSLRLWKGISGEDRAALYFAAACTGLREGTLALLEVSQFHVGPSDSIAFVHVMAEQIKDAEDLIVPIQSDAAAMLRNYLSSKLPAARAFRVPAAGCDFVRMLRDDEAEAKIDYCQRVVLPNGQKRRTRVLDFHAFRHTFGTRCARAGVPLPTLQKWMGHSDPKLTANIYNQVQLSDATASLNLMPRIRWG